MRGGLLVLLSFLMVATQANAASESLTTFEWPAQVGPGLDVAGATWVLVLLPSQHNVSLDASFPGGADATEYVRHLYGEVHGPVAGVTGVVQDGGQREESFDSFAAHLGPSQTWSSLFVAGSELHLNMTGLDGRVVLKRDGECMRDVPVELDDGYSQLARFGQLCPPGTHAVVALRSDRDLTAGIAEFNFSVAQAETVEWHGMNVTCRTTACPSGGPHTSETTTLPSGQTVTNHENTYVALRPRYGAAVSGRGQAAVVFVGGPGLDVAVAGRARFPASGLQGCDVCQPGGGQTLQVTGNFSLLRLHPDGDSRMAAHLQGEATQARLDEAIISPAALGLRVAGGTVAATAAVVALAAVARWLFSVFFTRHSEESALDNESRRRLYDFIVQHPGAHLREALRGVNLAAGVGRHHVTKLIRAGLVTERRHHHHVRLFPNESRFKESWREYAALRDPLHRLLYDWIAIHPDKKQNEIVSAMAEAHGWGRTATQKRVERLAGDGLLRIRHLGRLKLYSATEVLLAVPMPANSIPA